MFLPGILVVLKIFSIVISSWIVIHLLAAFGIFLAASYPFWWFIAPRSTVCLNCQARNKGDWCSFCGQQIPEDNHPKNLRSVLFNSLLILLFSIVSIWLVYLETSLVKKLDLLPKSSNVEFVVDDNSKYRLNEIFPMEINVGGIETPINAVQVDLSYDPDQLEAIELSTQGSFATVFIDKQVKNEVGYLRLTGGLPNPGYSLDRGLFGTVYFKAKKPGIATVEFLPTSVVLANDSRGTNVLKKLPSTTFYILDEEANYSDTSSVLDQVHLESDVLGEQDTSNQLHLYLKDRIDNAQDSPEILGATATRNNVKEGRFKKVLLRIDEMILALPETLLRIVF